MTTKHLVWATMALSLLLVSGCASTVPMAVYQPRETSEIQSYFQNGAAIAAIEGDNMLALAQIEPVTIMGTKYVRLWLLVENQSNEPLLLEPMKCARLTIESMSNVRRLGGKNVGFKPVDLVPASPTAILASISNAQASEAILSSIGAALEAGAQRPTTATTRDAQGQHVQTTTVNDLPQKQQAILEARAARAASRAAWYEAFNSSVNEGILRRNTLFTGQGVNGYVYFKVGFVNQPRQDDRRYRLTLALPEGEVVAAFDAIDGE